MITDLRLVHLLIAAQLAESPDQRQIGRHLGTRNRLVSPQSWRLNWHLKAHRDVLERVLIGIVALLTGVFLNNGVKTSLSRFLGVNGDLLKVRARPDL